MQDFPICTSIHIKFSLLLPFSKTMVLIISQLIPYLLYTLITEDLLCVWGDQIEYIFLIEFTNKLHNFAEPFKFKCTLKIRGFSGVKYLLISHDFFGLSHIKREVLSNIVFYLIISCYKPRPQRLFSLKEKDGKEGLFHFFKKFALGRRLSCYVKYVFV